MGVPTTITAETMTPDGSTSTTDPSDISVENTGFGESEGSTKLKDYLVRRLSSFLN